MNIITYNILESHFDYIGKTNDVKFIKLGKKKRQDMLEKSQKFVKRYSWVKTAKSTLKIYKSVMV